ncbi:MAG: hypothetical protein QOJ99_4293 [Bryobacterales bacterium]|nr:hypothetical protein [Bryobacterales bacterium]
MRIWRAVGLGLMAVCMWAQPHADRGDQPDAERTKESLRRLLERYPPSLRGVLALDPTLMTNQGYISPYPELVSFLNAHPDVVHNPSYYVGEYGDRRFQLSHSAQVAEMWRQVFEGFAVFAGFGMATGLLTWLVRTLIDYRRWHRLSKVQTDFHTKLLDRFTSNEDLLAYVQSPAGAKFLQSSPITLDAGPRSMGAPLGRILWSAQAGLVMAAIGIGLQVASRQLTDDASQPLHVLGILGISLGAGFALSALMSFVISQRLGLLERGPGRTDTGLQG